MGSLEELRSEFAALKKLRVLAKARMSAGHSAMVADLQALHDHPDTHEHVRAAIAPILAKHAPKPKVAKTPKPAPTLDHELIDHYAERLHDRHLGAEHYEPTLDALHRDKRMTRPHMVALHGRLSPGVNPVASTSRATAFERIRRKHDFYEAAGARRTAIIP